MLYEVELWSTKNYTSGETAPLFQKLKTYENGEEALFKRAGKSRMEDLHWRYLMKKAEASFQGKHLQIGNAWQVGLCVFQSNVFGTMTIEFWTNIFNTCSAQCVELFRRIIWTFWRINSNCPSLSSEDQLLVHRLLPRYANKMWLQTLLFVRSSEELWEKW